jgi:hypothetical protein
MIAATPKEIFKAIEDPTLLAKWWGPDGFTNTFNAFEFKPNGKWSFVMHGPDGSDYPNENKFLEIECPGKVVIRHDCNPYFTAALIIEAVENGSLVKWSQDFDSEEVAESIAHIISPANIQLLDKLNALVMLRINNERE